MYQLWYTSRLTIDVIHTFGRMSRGRKQVNKQFIGVVPCNMDRDLKLRSIAYRYTLAQYLTAPEDRGPRGLRMCGFYIANKRGHNRIHELKGNGERVRIVIVIKSHKSVVSGGIVSWVNTYAKPQTKNTNK